MGTILKFFGPDAGRAQTMYKNMSTTGDTGERTHTDLHALGETNVAAVADEIQQEDNDHTEKFTTAQAQARFVRWQRLDLDQAPDPVWSALYLGAHSVFEAIGESAEHDRAYSIDVIDDPYDDSRRILFVTLLHTDDSDAGENGESAPVHGDTIIVMVPDQDALTQITELLSQDPELLQGWWIGALQEYAAVVDMPSEIIETVLMRSIMTAIHYPFPDASGRIRCPRGVDFEVVDTAAQETAVNEVRENGLPTGPSTTLM